MEDKTQGVQLGRAEVLSVVVGTNSVWMDFVSVVVGTNSVWMDIVSVLERTIWLLRQYTVNNSEQRCIYCLCISQEVRITATRSPDHSYKEQATIQAQHNVAVILRSKHCYTLFTSRITFQPHISKHFAIKAVSKSWHVNLNAARTTKQWAVMEVTCGWLLTWNLGSHWWLGKVAQKLLPSYSEVL